MPRHHVNKPKPRCTCGHVKGLHYHPGPSEYLECLGFGGCACPGYDPLMPDWKSLLKEAQNPLPPPAR